MTRAAIVKGIARWYGKEVCPRFPAMSPKKLMGLGAVYAAEANPALAETALVNVKPELAPIVGPLLSAANDDAAFDLFVQGFSKALEKEPMKIDVLIRPEGPVDLLFHASDLALVVGEIRNAQTEIERADVIKAAKAKNSGAANAPTA